MNAVAILVGSSAYSRLQPLPCCRTDMEAVAALLDATGRFEMIHRVFDTDATELKRQIRTALATLKDADEIFFYFSGHGYSNEGEFYFCAREFDVRRPNETGLSNSELTALFREASPELVVKVIDACSSGTLLIKSDGHFLSSEKGGLKNLVQIASCLDSQTSLAGDPLSEFTEKFCLAALRKSEGPLYYIDMIAVLRDAYLDNPERSPHFVFQTSARETFIGDASRLVSFRARFEADWLSKPRPETIVEHPSDTSAPVQSPSLTDVFLEAEAELAKPTDIPFLVNAIFDGLLNRLSNEKFSDFFAVEVAEHADFRELTTREFIIEILNQEKRQDQFVKAIISRKRKRSRDGHGFVGAAIAFAMYDPDDFVETWDLALNLSMDRAQLCITLSPKFSVLQRIVLVVTCAPSMEHCYVFEMLTIHLRTDWGVFADRGQELTRRWYRLAWHRDVGSLVDKISKNLKEAVENHVQTTAERRSKG